MRNTDIFVLCCNVFFFIALKSKTKVLFSVSKNLSFQMKLKFTLKIKIATFLIFTTTVDNFSGNSSNIWNFTKHDNLKNDKILSKAKLVKFYYHHSFQYKNNNYKVYKHDFTLIYIILCLKKM